MVIDVYARLLWPKRRKTSNKSKGFKQIQNTMPHNEHVLLPLIPTVSYFLDF